MEENKDKKVIDLGILSHLKDSGVAEIALVEEPAIELDFLYFKKEEFDIDTAGLAPYEDPGIKPKRIQDIYSEDVIETILQLASELGVHSDDVQMVEKFAIDPKDAQYTPARTITKADGVEILYKYSSSRTASNSREFCTRLMGLSRFYSREEIDALDTFNEEFGPGVGGGQYSIFKYKGGANCQHFWRKYEAQRVDGRLQVYPAEPTDNIQRMAETAPRATNGRGYVKRPQRSLSPLPGNSAFSKIKELEFKFADDEKKIVIGPAMIPDMEILRRTDDGKPYYVRFSEETIREIAMKYMKEARTNATNTDHDTGERAGAYVYESWIVENAEDKANTLYGYNVPIGTWMIAMKVDNPETWKRVKAGELKGFSVEGAFADMEEIEAQKQYQKIMDILKKDI